MLSRLCELTQWVVWSLGASSTAAVSEACKLLISSFKSCITCSLVLTRSASSWALLFSSSISQFFPLTQLPALHSAFSVTGKRFRLVHGAEQALSTASRSRDLARHSAMVRCVLSGSFFSAEEALIGNCIFFCCHCSYYI